ncbi:MAG: DUF2207 domain-containing protein [Chloroflexi bacterium]|nr:DUF2207 domain-containing protein [Chloroflexota bacterium]
MRKTLSLLIVYLLLLGLATSADTALAQTKSVTWQRFDVDIAVQPNGDLHVVETQAIEFNGGPFTSGFAVIPLKNTDGITDIAVSEPGQAYLNTSSNSDYTYAVSGGGSELNVDWFFPPTSNVTRTFELAYTVHGAIRRYDSGDILQYKAISEQFEFQALSSTVTVHLPPGGEVVTDPESLGALMAWETSPDSLTVTYASAGTIQPYESVEIGVAFKHGAVNGPQPSWQAEFDRQATYEDTVKPLLNLGLVALGLVLLLALPGGLYLIWYLFGRDPNPGLVPEYITEPPSDLPPGLVGTLVDETADMRDLTATLIDFARRGLVTMEAQETAGAFGTSASSFTLKKSGEPDKLRGYEKTLYDAVFATQNERALNQMPESFFAKLPFINSSLYAETVKEGLFKANPDSVRGNYIVGGVVVVIITLIVGFVAAAIGSAYTSAIICPFVPLVMFGIGLAALSRRMPAKTRKGAEEAAKWMAFQKYLGNIQKYRDVAGAVDQFEKYLPYAIAFGLERRWVSAFAKAPNIVVPAPRWYTYRPRPILTGSPPGSITKNVGEASPTGAGQMPNLNQMGESMIGGLNQMGDGLITALNTAGRSFSTPPAPKYTYSGGGSRGTSGGSRTFRSGGGSSRSGGFRSSGGFRGGGSSGGGRRGFR